MCFLGVLRNYFIYIELNADVILLAIFCKKVYFLLLKLPTMEETSKG